MRCYFFFFQAEDGIRDGHVTGVQTCALPISQWCPTSHTIVRTRSIIREALPASAERSASRQTPARSEERRVGKECRSRWSTYHEKKKKNNNIIKSQYKH